MRQVLIALHNLALCVHAGPAGLELLILLSPSLLHLGYSSILRFPLALYRVFPQSLPLPEVSLAPQGPEDGAPHSYLTQLDLLTSMLVTLAPL